MTSWRWVPWAWVVFLAVAGGIATVLALQDQNWLIVAVSILAFPAGLIIPPTFDFWLFALGGMVGIENLRVVAPIVFGLAFAVCAGVQVAIFRVIKERFDRKRRFNAWAEKLEEDKRTGSDGA